MDCSSISVRRDGYVILDLGPSVQVKRRRVLGYMSGDGQTFHTERDVQRHVFGKKKKFIGFNYELLSRGHFHLVVVHFSLTSEKLVTSRRFILEHGFFLHFQRAQLERQIFFPVEMFGLPRALRWERENAQAVDKKTFLNFQPSLFE